MKKAHNVTTKRVHIVLIKLGRPELHIHINKEWRDLKNHPLDLDITPELIAQNLLWRYPGCPNRNILSY
jgi:hypothetical protein